MAQMRSRWGPDHAMLTDDWDDATVWEQAKVADCDLIVVVADVGALRLGPALATWRRRDSSRGRQG